MARRPRTRSFGARYAPLLVALVAVLVFVGLRTDDNIGVDLPRSGAETTDDVASTTTTEKDAPPATVPTSTTTPVLDDPEDVPASLRNALLAPGDLPPGWREAAVADRGTAVCPGHDPAADVRPESALKASFAEGDTGPYLSSLVAEFDGDDEADEFLDALEDALDACDRLEDEGGLTYDVEQSDGANIGDRSVAATVEISSASGGQLRGRILAVSVGDRITMITFSASSDADAAIAVDALEAVVARLEG